MGHVIVICEPPCWLLTSRKPDLLNNHDSLNSHVICLMTAGTMIELDPVM